jgi:methionyl-tRNA formyltransferase
MRLLFFGNNWLAWKILKLLKQRSVHLVGIVVHPEENQKYGKEILDTAKLPDERIFLGNQLKDKSVRESIRCLKPDLGLSVMFGYILDPKFIEFFPSGIINLHPSYLPYNRGHYPNVWCIIEKTPAGVTLHYIDSGIDTGDIIAQMKVDIDPADTGKSLYHKLEQAGVELFKKTWPLIERKSSAARKQIKNEGTFHRSKDIDRIDPIQLDRQYSARELINILRARNFPPYKGAYFVDQGRKIYLSLTLTYKDQHYEKNNENSN